MQTPTTAFRFRTMWRKTSPQRWSRSSSPTPASSTKWSGESSRRFVKLQCFALYEWERDEFSAKSCKRQTRAIRHRTRFNANEYSTRQRWSANCAELGGLGECDNLAEKSLMLSAANIPAIVSATVTNDGGFAFLQLLAADENNLICLRPVNSPSRPISANIFRIRFLTDRLYRFLSPRHSAIYCGTRFPADRRFEVPDGFRWSG